MERMITDSEATEDLKSMFRRMFSAEEHFIVEYPMKDRLYKYIVPLTEGDEYGVMSHVHYTIPHDMEVLCMDMDIFLGNYLTADNTDMAEKKPFSKASSLGMYIFPQEVK